MVFFVLKALLDLAVFSVLGALVLALFSYDIEASNSDVRALVGFFTFVFGFTFLRAFRRWQKRSK